jgi:penicillin-binding protein 2
MSELLVNPGVEIRNAQLEIHHFRWRLIVSMGVVLTMFALLFGRFFYLQVIQHEHFHTLAEANRISIMPIAPNRGIIADRNGVVLAHNYSAYTLEITPSRVRDLDALIDELSTLVEIAPKDRRRFKKLLEESRNFESLPIRTRLSNARPFRHYPQGDMFSHVVGHIGRINQRELEQLEADNMMAAYRGTTHIGKLGLEQSYESVLHGTTGVENVEVDSGGRAVRTLSRTPPQSGDNLVLKLAFVSKPGFDPNLFVDGIDTQSWNELNTSPDRPMINRALAGTYPPGSTFKPFMALAALFYGKRTPQQVIHDPGYFMFGGRQFRDSRPGGHGQVDLHKSIVVSSDVYYYMLANDLGIDAISRFMTIFGFGSRTGIDLPGESAGILPSQEWKMRRFKQKWFAGETISIGIGQGYNSYTPLQLALATATLANDGVMFRPHIVDYIENASTRERTKVEPRPLRTLDLKPEHIAVVKQGMIGVNKEGTGARVFAGAPYTSAGKTGTAQVVGIKQGEKYVESRVQERHRDHSWFIAFAPAEKPVIALAVIVENGGFGARAAAPIARQVFDYYLLGKKPAQPAPEDENASPH